MEIIDLRPTTMYLDALMHYSEERTFVKDKYTTDIRDKVKVYDLLIENMKLISKRFTYTVNIKKISFNFNTVPKDLNHFQFQHILWWHIHVRAER